MSVEIQDKFGTKLSLSYHVGDKVAFAYGDHDVSGTIGYICRMSS